MFDKIQLSHGGGGKLSAQLIEEEILSRFGDGPLSTLPDASELKMNSKNIVFSTDSYVVTPYKFKGGNIGSLAVHGTVNDVSVGGGNPKYLSLGLIIEEGFLISDLRLILDTIKKAADECGVTVATGDTKVVPRGLCDGIYINTSGIGEKIEAFNLGKKQIREGDVVIVSGTIGDHGMAILAEREEMEIENGPVSDTGPVHRLVSTLVDIGNHVRFMRDPTRGGVATVLNEIVENSKLEIVLESEDIPVADETIALSEMLGIDLLNVACEGRMLLICDKNKAEAVLKKWKNLPEGRNSALIGKVLNGKGRVRLNTVTGGSRLVDTPTGELLPRIC